MSLKYHDEGLHASHGATEASNIVKPLQYHDEGLTKCHQVERRQPQGSMELVEISLKFACVII